jgi:hypothetical protein
MVSEEMVLRVRDRVRNQGFWPATQVVRAIIETYLEEDPPATHGTDMVEIINRMHPRTVVRRELPTGVEEDIAFCEWCGVPAPCPEMQVLDALQT